MATMNKKEIVAEAKELAVRMIIAEMAIGHTGNADFEDAKKEIESGLKKTKNIASDTVESKPDPFALLLKLLSKLPKLVESAAKALERPNLKDLEQASDSYHRKAGEWLMSIAELRKDDFVQTTLEEYMYDCHMVEWRVADLQKDVLVKSVVNVLIRKIAAVANEEAAFGGFGLSETDVGKELTKLAESESNDSFTTASSKGWEREVEDAIAKMEGSEL